MNIKTNFPKIISEQFPHDMGPWLTEKSEYALKALVELRKDIIKVEGDIDKTTLDYIYNDLSYAIFQLTKIYSFSVGSKWDNQDEDLLFCKLDNGFEELQVKYGLLDKTSEQIHKEKIDNFYATINEFLNMEQDPGRTLLQELFENHTYMLNDSTLSARLLKKIDKILWEVADGQKPWTEFVSEAKVILTDILRINSRDTSIIPSRKRNWDPGLNDYV